MTGRLWACGGILMLAASCGCGGLGRVNQGQVVGFDREKGLATLILDSNPADPLHPRYDTLPPAVVRIPHDPREMGPLPDAGTLLAVDLEKSELVMFDPATQGLRSIPFTLVDRQDKIALDDARVARAKLPRVDREQRTVTIYLSKRRQLLTISVAPEVLNLPADRWRVGDEVRYYFKSPDRALRLMNVTKTDVNKSGK
ncbi:MAG: DUF4881 domain-containing protein [Acidobacteria bacterium]|nr:DUF4881 domain-containing protein [Acidobacteriota bacterium]